MNFDEENAEFDWGCESNRPFGLSEIQYRLTRGLLAGETKIKVAADAGYKITDDNNGRSNASKAARSPRVQAAIAAYRSWQGEKPEADVDEKELVNLLSKSVRNPTTPGERVQAAALLNKIHESRRERESLNAASVADLVERLEGGGEPIMDAMAVLVAAMFETTEPILKSYRLTVRAWQRLRRAYAMLAGSLEHEFGHAGARPNDADPGQALGDYYAARRTAGNGAAGADGLQPEMVGARP